MTGPLPDGLALTIAHCDQPMRYRTGRTAWAGEYERTSVEFVCWSCGLSVVVSASEHVGPPQGVAQ